MASIRSFRRFTAVLILWKALALPVSGQIDDSDISFNGGDAYFRQALTALDAGNVDRATDIFQAARQEAGKNRDTEAKARAQDGLKRIRGVYAPFYEQLNRALSLRQKGDLAGAQIAARTALGLMEKPKLGSPAEWRDIDQRLVQRARSEGDLIQRQRLQQYRERMSAAEALVWERHYDRAVPELESAKSLLIPEQEESQIQIVDRMIKEANYNLHFEDGRKLTEQGDLKGALAQYKEAAGHVDNYEVQERIKETESRLHYALLAEAQDAYKGGKYSVASEKMQDAAAYRESPYLDQFRKNAYDELFNQGRQSFTNAQYDKALEQYRAAQLFDDNETIQQEISAAKNADVCQAKLDKAKQLIERQQLSSARRQLLQAARLQQNNNEVNTRLSRIDAYFGKIIQGRKLLKTDPVTAHKLFSEAYQLFPTDEAKQYMDKAQAQGGGVGFG